jgi:UDP-glucuronate 4-epimerase
VYGMNPGVPWREGDADLQPISPYASTKLSAEFLGRVYSHLFQIRFVALRLFTVYGPRQRPDLAIRKFAELICAGRPLPFYGDGTTSRDYTYVDDIVSGIRAALRFDRAMFEIINLGNNRTVTMLEMVRGIEQALGMPATLEQLPEQPGDVPRTWADIEKARTLLGYQPRTTYAEGVVRFVAWLREPHELPATGGA